MTTYNIQLKDIFIVSSYKFQNILLVLTLGFIIINMRDKTLNRKNETFYEYKENSCKCVCVFDLNAKLTFQ